VQGNGSDAQTTSFACIDAETLAAWADGGLSKDEAALVEVHLADCERCTAMLATFARSRVAVDPVASAMAGTDRDGGNSRRSLGPRPTSGVAANRRARERDDDRFTNSGGRGAPTSSGPVPGQGAGNQREHGSIRIGGHTRPA
jgi:anti-sigma factor RsiW